MADLQLVQMHQPTTVMWMISLLLSSFLNCDKAAASLLEALALGEMTVKDVNIIDDICYILFSFFRYE